MPPLNLFKSYIILIGLFLFTSAYDMQTLNVQPNSYIINTYTSYTIVMDRTLTSSGDAAPYNTSLVPAGANITIQFPIQYNTSVGYTCNAPYSNCTVSGQNLVISGLYTSPTIVTTLTIIINHILNPTPAVQTGQFMGYIGNDYTVTNSLGLDTVTLQPATFATCGITFTPGYVNKTQSMIITLTPTNPIPTTGQIQINFPNPYWYNDIRQTYFLSSSGLSCSNGSSNVSPLLTFNINSTTQITVSSLFTTSNNNTSFSIIVNNILSPPSPQQIDLITLYSFVSGYELDTCSVYVQGLIPNVLTFSISATPVTTMYVNQPYSLKFSITLVDFINNNNTFMVTFPTGSNVTLINMNSQISITGSQLTNGTILTFSQPSTPVRVNSPGNTLNFTFSNYTAPSSTLTTSNFTFGILKGGSVSQIGYATLTATASALTFTVTPVVSTINQNTTYQFTITITDGITSGGMFLIVFPSAISLSFSSTNCASSSGTLMNSAPTCNQSGNSLYLSNLNSTTNNFASTTFNINITGVINPASTQPTSNFTVSSFYNSNINAMVSTGTGGSVTSTAGILNSSLATVISTSYLVGDTGASYTFTFTIADMIPVGGYVVIGIPTVIYTAIGSVSNYCFSKILGASSYSSSTCSGTSNSSFYFVKFTNLFQSASAAINSTLNLQIQSVFTNPPSTQIVNTFIITTYSAAGYPIDQLTSGLSLQMTIPAPFSSITGSALSAINSATTYYSFTLSQSSSISSGALLYIYFPSQISLSSLSTVTDLNGNALSSIINSNIIIISLATGTNSANFGVNISNIKNGPSLKSSSPFGFATKTFDGLNFYSQNLSAITITNKVASKFASIYPTFNNQTLKAIQSITITFIPTSIITGYAIVTLASSFTVNNFICNSLSFGGTCAIGSNSNVMNITGFSSIATVSITLSGFTSPSYVPSDYTTLSSYDASGFLIDQSVTDLLFTLNCTLPCKTCSGSITNCTSCYNQTSITSYIYYDAINYNCFAICLSGFYSTDTTFSCLTCSTICATCINSSTNCQSCVTASSNPYLNRSSSSNATCVSSCPLYYYPDTTTVPIICVLCINPCSTCTSNIRCLSCNSTTYFYNYTCGTTCPTTITVANSSTNNCDTCASVCATCSIMTSNCTSCSVSTGAALHNGTCVNPCPTNLVAYQGLCTSCTSPCLTCVNTPINCTSCVNSSSTPYLTGNNCTAVCPNFYFSNATAGICQSCSSVSSLNCNNCINATACNSCDVGYVLITSTSACSSTTPSGYVNISGIAVTCSGNCSTCSVTVTNCTSCAAGNLLSNTCVATCPSGTVSINNICQTCVSPCITCTILTTNCLSCDSSLNLFLLGAFCVSTCPSTTYANVTTTSCAACVSPCLTCTTSTICLTCVSGYNLFNNNCQVTCPEGYVGISSICQICTSPCASCSISLTNCTSCLLNIAVYYTPYTCVSSSSCPSGTYANSTTFTCAACIFPCSTCSSNISCLSCVSTYNFFNNNCLSSCTAGYVSINSGCLPCTNNCSTCYTIQSNCTSCISMTPALFLTNNLCVIAANCPTGTYANTTLSICDTCPNPCASCSNYSYCLSCITGTSLYNGACPTICPSGYYSFFLVCTVCSSPCSTCINSSTTCTSCLTNLTTQLYLTNNLCVQSNGCPAGTYANSTFSNCSFCVSPCATCSNTTFCLTCTSGNYLMTGICSNTCAIGYIGLDGVCVACISPCLTCSGSATSCLSCISNLSPAVYLTGTSCVIASACPYTTYANSTHSSCTSCVSPCAACSNITYCLACVSGSSLYNGTCSSSCPSGYYSLSQICTLCNSPCATCSTSALTCTSCISGLSPSVFLANSNCVLAANCPSGTYPNTTNSKCENCISPCSTCSNISYCLSCIIGSSLYNGSCLTNCPSGYYSLNQICTLCVSPCNSCTGPTSCLSCLSGLNPLLYFSGSQCIIASLCPNGTYANSTQVACELCTSPCNTCVDSVNCLTCINTYYLFGTICSTTCLAGYLGINGYCVICTSPCSTCSIALTNCTSCLPTINPMVYLNGNSCVIASSCPSGTYPDANTQTCVLCVSPCATCTNSTICVTCLFNFYYNGTCTATCPSGYLGVGLVCIACTSPCLTCSLSLDNCTSCLSTISPSLFLTGNQCVISSSCPSGTYGNVTNNLCAACLPPCVTCSNISACITCSDGYNLFNNTCLSTCLSNQIPINSVCINCTSPCLSCFKYVTQCVSCDPSVLPAVYLSINSCVTSCPSTFYANVITLNCSACISPCYTCTSNTSCQSCVPTYYLYNNQCLIACPLGYLATQGSQVCTICTSPCLTCAFLLTNCTSCVTTVTPNVYLSGNRCLQTCPLTTFPNITSATCINCISPCATCTTDVLCLSCVSPYLQYNTTSCLMNCPLGYVNINQICTQCTSNCLTCINSTSTCLSCTAGYYFFNSTNSCFVSCPSGYYADSPTQTCMACVSPCSTCTTAVICLTCAVNYFYNGICTAICPSGYVGINFICVTCTSPCLTCSVQLTNCTGCISNLSPPLFLHENQCVISSACPSGTYGNSTSSTCATCVPPCVTCSSASICLTCNPGYNLLSGSCLTNCLSNQIPINSVCINCTSPCLTCFTFITQCVSCDPSVLPAVYLSINSCVTSCPSTFYANVITLNCSACISPCYTCTSNTSCQSCVPTYYLYNNQCLVACPLGYLATQSSQVCTICTSPCSACSVSLTNCTACDITVTPHVYLSGNRCLQTCPANTFPNITSAICTSCISPCATCTTDVLCLSCVSPYLQYNTTSCLMNCPLGYVNINQICTQCTSNCLTCINSTSTCLSCTAGYYFFNSTNSCFVSCPSGYYADSPTQTCMACVSPCSTCTTAVICLTCAVNYFYNGICTAICPSGYVGINFICVTCTSPCLTCSVQLTNCTACISNLSPPLFLHENQCVISSACPSGTYGNSTSSTCATCVPPCVTCSSASICLTCNPGYNLLSGSCLTNCLSNQIPINSVCINCTSPCLTCFTFITQCVSCDPSVLPAVYLSINSCVTSCPSTFYANVITLNCSACISPCYTCTSNTSCQSCVPTYYLYNNQCLVACPLGYLATQSSQVCTICTSPCSACSVSLTNCTACDITVTPHVYLSGNRCLQTCPANTFPNITSAICTSCISPCATCTTDVLCLSCVSPYLQYNTTSCLTNCPLGYVNINQICTQCTSNCLTCINSTSTCLSCTAGYYFFNSTNSCFVSCPSGYYADSPTQTCMACVSPCSTCTTAVICLTCAVNYFYNGICTAICPSGYVGINFICVTCTSPCLTCSVQLTNCTACISNLSPPLFLHENQCVISSACPSGTYGNSTSSTCATCVPPCVTCSSASICLTCNPGYNLLSGSCLTNCLSNQIPINSVCINCTSPCLTCFTFITQCVSCDPSVLPAVYLSINSCVTSCPSTFYANVITLNCSACISPCYTCTSNTSCSSCVPTYYLYNNQCLIACPLGYLATQSSQVCTICTSPCSACSVSLTNCTACDITVIPNVYLSGNRCLQTCPANTFPNITSAICTSCISPCATCTTDVLCLSCVSPYLQYNTTSCLMNCPLGYVNINQICTQCTSNCLTCINSTSTCLSCTAGYYFFNSTNSCFVSCPSGYYADSATQTCLVCISPCSTCTTAVICLTCAVNYFYNGICTAICPSGYVGINFICVTCTSPCLTCSVQLTNCTACISNLSPPLFLHGNQCVISSACPSGTYGNSTSSTCATCVPPCVTCSSASICLTCNPGYNLLSGSCLTNCLSNQIPINSVCINCTSPCLTCFTFITQCVSCDPSVLPAVYLSINSCVTSCPSTFYANVITLNCSACISPCYTCTSNTSCSSCVPTYYLYNNQCLVACPLGYLATQSSQVCTICTSPCSACSVSLTNCTACDITVIPNVYLSGNRCLQNCPANTFPNITSAICTSCISPCATCTTDVLCLSCVSPYLQYNTTSCLMNCPLGYVNINQICTQCTSNCLTCINSTSTCLSCTAGYYFFNSTNSCFVSCPSGYYADSATQTCMACVSPCSTCTTAVICLTCAVNYFYNGICTAICPSGYVGINFICVTCTSPCLTCSVQLTNCTACISNLSPPLFLHGNQCVISSACPSGTYGNSTSSTCATCVPPCVTCSSASICLTCNPGYNLLSGSCLTNCLSNQIPINSVCINCTSPCLTCFTFITQCVSCDPSVLPAVYLSINSCVTSCPSTFYANVITLNCSACISPCYTCTSNTSCSSCVPTYYLYNNQCLVACPLGYLATQSSQVCTICTSPCSACSVSLTNCTACDITVIPNVYLSGNRCLQTCPANTFPNITSAICTSCISPCATCTTDVLCLSCVSPYLQYNTTSCLMNCPLGYVNINQICTQCTSNCLTCINSTSTCLSCTAGYYFFNSTNSCFVSCPSGYYADSATQTCLVCISPCSTCTTAVICLTCAVNYFYNGICTAICPSGYVGINFICVTCTSPCLTCSVQLTNCTACISNLSPPLFLHGNQCVISSACPSGTYGNSTSSTCATCVPPCVTCSSASICLTCNPGYNLLSGSCLTNCLSNQIPINSVCINCTSPCLTCFTFITQCVSCDPSVLPAVYLSINSCVTSCPSTFYANVITLNCSACISPCYTCTSNTSCSSCVPTYYLYNNQCLVACPLGYLATQSSQVCTICTSPCSACSVSLTNCTACDITVTPNVYLSGNRCLQTCPTNTFPNITSAICTSCISPCATCTTDVLCLSCVSPYLQYNTTSCLTNCPLGYINVNQICTQCTSNCLTCINLTSICLSCVAGFYYLASTHSCLSICPSGLYSNPNTLTCDGCTSPCATCINAPTNCTTCSTNFYLYGNLCVNSCPITYYSNGSICSSCPSGCGTCTSLSNCLTCQTGYYLYTTSCLTQCPPTRAVIVNETCTACTAINCITCTQGDSCLTCQSPFLVSLGQCVTSCPINTTNNGTDCITNTTTQNLTSTLSNSKIFPLPFTIGGTVIIILCSISKFQNPNTFLAGAIYSLLSILQWGVLIIFGFFYWQQINFKIDLLFWGIVAALGSLYLVNILNFFVYISVVRTDIKYKNWYNKSVSTRSSSIITTIVSLFISHKFCNIVYCRLFNFSICKAQLENLRKFFWINFMSVLSLIHTFIAVGISAYIAYLHSGNMSQTYIQAIDTIIVTVFCLLFAFANSHKDDSFFEESFDGVTLNKKILDSEQFKNQKLQPSGNVSETEKGFLGKYKHDELGDDSQMSVLALEAEQVDATGEKKKQQDYLSGISQEKEKEYVEISIQAEQILHYSQVQSEENIFNMKTDDIKKKTEKIASQKSQKQNLVYLDKSLQDSFQQSSMRSQGIQNDLITIHIDKEPSVDIIDKSLHNSQIQSDKFKSDKIQYDKLKSDNLQYDKQSDKIQYDKLKSDNLQSDKQSDKFKSDKIQYDKLKSDNLQSDKQSDKFKLDNKTIQMSKKEKSQLEAKQKSIQLNYGVDYKSIEKSLNNESETLRTQRLNQKGTALEKESIMLQTEQMPNFIKNDKEIQLQKKLKDKQLELERIRKEVQQRQRQNLARRSQPDKSIDLGSRKLKLSEDNLQDTSKNQSKIMKKDEKLKPSPLLMESQEQKKLDYPTGGKKNLEKLEEEGLMSNKNNEKEGIKQLVGLPHSEFLKNILNQSIGEKSESSGLLEQSKKAININDKQKLENTETLMKDSKNNVKNVKDMINNKDSKNLNIIKDNQIIENRKEDSEIEDIVLANDNNKNPKVNKDSKEILDGNKISKSEKKNTISNTNLNNISNNNNQKEQSNILVDNSKKNTIKSQNSQNEQKKSRITKPPKRNKQSISQKQIKQEELFFVEQNKDAGDNAIKKEAKNILDVSGSQINKSNSHTIEQMKQYLQELKGHENKQRPPEKNFTFNKDELQIASKLSEEDLQNMRSLKSELQNNEGGIEIIEEEDQHPEERQQDIYYTSSDVRKKSKGSRGRTRKTKAEDETSKQKNLQSIKLNKNNQSIEEKARHDNKLGNNRGFLSQQQGLRFKKGDKKYQKETDQIEISESDQGDYIKPPIIKQIQPVTIKIDEKLDRPNAIKRKYDYEQENAEIKDPEHEIKQKPKQGFTIDDDEIEKSVKQDEDDLYKQPAYFPSASKYPKRMVNFSKPSQEQDFSIQRPLIRENMTPGSDNTIEEFAPEIRHSSHHVMPVQRHKNRIPEEKKGPMKSMKGPIMLTAGHSSYNKQTGDKRLNKKSTLKSNSPNKQMKMKNVTQGILKPEVLETGSEISEPNYPTTNINPKAIITQQSREDSARNNLDNKRLIAPRKFNVVYDTSDIAEGDSLEFAQLGISPSDYNQYNQRYDEPNSGQRKFLLKNDLPNKPQIMVSQSKGKQRERGYPVEVDISQEYSRINNMKDKNLGNKQRNKKSNERKFQVQISDNNVLDHPEDEELRDFYARQNSQIRKKQPSRNKETEKIYLQRLEIPKKRSSSRDKL